MLDKALEYQPPVGMQEQLARLRDLARMDAKPNALAKNYGVATLLVVLALGLRGITARAAHGDNADHNNKQRYSQIGNEQSTHIFSPLAVNIIVPVKKQQARQNVPPRNILTSKLWLDNWLKIMVAAATLPRLNRALLNSLR